MARRRTSSRPAVVILAICALVLGWTDNRLSAGMAWRYPAVNELVVTEHYLTDVGALLLGAHRLAADIAYVQFLQYYGISANAAAEEEEEGHDEHEGAPSAHPRSALEHAREHDITRGDFPRLKELATRIVRLDPYFNAVILEAAGALAFNQKRVDESLDLLREAIERDPSFFRYHLYVSAILYKEKGNDAGMIDLLLEAIKYPDCPPMFEMILGNLLKKVGRLADAARVYHHTYLTAAKDYERDDALRRLKALLALHPELERVLAAEPAR